MAACSVGLSRGPFVTIYTTTTAAPRLVGILIDGLCISAGIRGWYGIAIGWA